MKAQNAFRQKQRIDALLEKAEYMNEDPELLAHWARYLCVIISGFIENAVREIFCEYVQNRSAPSVTRYVTRSLSSFKNPKMEKIIQTAVAFDATWGEKIREFVDDGDKDAVDSIVAQRNSIAHGQDTSLSLHTLREYYKKAVNVLEYLEMLCNN